MSAFLEPLQKLLAAVFDKVLVPVLEDVASILINLAGELIQNILSGFLLKILIILLKVIKFMEDIFNVFSGISNVNVTEKSPGVSLLQFFFQLSEIRVAFLAITLLAVFLAFITTLVSVARSMSDSVLDNGNPISHVFKESLKAVISFMIVPLMCLFMLQLATNITAILNKTMNASASDSTMSDIIFISCASDGAKSSKIVTDYSHGQKYENAEQVKKDFDIKKINYVLGYISTALVAILLLVIILQFIRRIIEILILYLVAPLFVATIPMDDGAKFKEWKDYFTATMFSAFGPIMMMKIYFLVTPTLVSSSVTYTNSAWTDSMIKLFLVMGGAYAVFKGQHMVTTILNPMVGGSMAESGFLATMIGHKVQQKVRGGGGRGGRPGGGAQSSGQYMTKSQAFTGK